PAHLTVVLLASNPGHVLQTILSRAVELRVPLPTPTEALHLLTELGSIPPAKAEALLARADGDIVTALEIKDERLADLPGQVDALLKAASEGDVLALLRAAALLRKQPEALPLAVGALLRLAATAPAEGAEAAIEGAAALLTAERRSAALHTDLEGAAIAALAGLLPARR
ncbi:MAG: hypothetical protein V1750_01720, partial [Acidobacteriota bacterium]